MAETYNMSGGAYSMPNSKTTIRNTGEAGIEYSFVNGHTTPLVQGQLVKLNAAGEVVPIAAAIDKPIGTVIIGNTEDKRVTVKTYFKQIVNVVTSAAITAGANLTTASFNATNQMNVVTVAVATNYASYVALETVTAAAGTVLIVGELFQPILTA